MELYPVLLTSAKIANILPGRQARVQVRLPLDRRFPGRKIRSESIKTGPGTNRDRKGN